MSVQIEINGIRIPYDASKLLDIIITEDEPKKHVEMGPVRILFKRKAVITGSKEQDAALYVRYPPAGKSPGLTFNGYSRGTYGGGAVAGVGMAGMGVTDITSPTGILAVGGPAFYPLP